MSATLASVRRPESSSLIAALVLSGCTCAGTLPGRKAVRPPEFAGEWYERDPETLARALDELLAKAEPEAGPVQAVLIPHAAHYWSGAVVGRTLGALKGKRYARIVMLGSSHDPVFRGVALPAEGGFQTPLGPTQVDERAVALLERYPLFGRRATAFDHEYALEVNLPFVQRLWPEAKLVPVLIGDVEDEELAEVGRTLRNALDEDTLLVATMTMTHFGPAHGYEPFEPKGDKAEMEQALRAFEKPLVDAMVGRNPAQLLDLWRETGARVCGLTAALAALHALGEGEQGRVAAQGSTMDVEFDPDDPSGTSYVGFVFPGRFPAVPELGEAEKRLLGRLAWDAVYAAVTGRELSVPDDLPARLTQPGGAFVTITLHGQLRGCMGLLEAESLSDAVVRAGQMAARSDPRFSALRPELLSQIELEVSALGPFVPIASGEDFEPGRHGLLLTHGFNRGLLLPQVATKYGMGREEYLEALAEKAGLRADRWRQAKLLRFGVQAFFPSRQA
jgi:AmmeMemoRadiSam system protein B/AmmeMemoRadiSam system protein A